MQWNFDFHVMIGGSDAVRLLPHLNPKNIFERDNPPALALITQQQKTPLELQNQKPREPIRHRMCPVHPLPHHIAPSSGIKPTEDAQSHSQAQIIHTPLGYLSLLEESRCLSQPQLHLSCPF
jgi:hypothetical protein